MRHKGLISLLDAARKANGDRNLAPLPTCHRFCLVTPCGSELQKEAGNELNFSFSGIKRNGLETQDTEGQHRNRENELLAPDGPVSRPVGLWN